MPRSVCWLVHCAALDERMVRAERVLTACLIVATDLRAAGTLGVSGEFLKLPQEGLQLGFGLCCRGVYPAAPRC